MGVTITRRLTRLWSTQAKVEGIVLRAAWHWGRARSVVNNPLWEPDHTPLYVGLPSAWGSMDGDLMFLPIYSRAPFWGLWQTCMNEWTNGSGDGVSLSMGTLLGNMERASLPGTLTER